MEKRYNIYSMGNLVLKDSTLERLKNNITKNHSIFTQIENLRSNEICSFNDNQTGRPWEFERIL